MFSEYLSRCLPQRVFNDGQSVRFSSYSWLIFCDAKFYTITHMIYVITLFKHLLELREHVSKVALSLA